VADATPSIARPVGRAGAGMNAMVGLGLRASKGGAVAVGLMVHEREPRILVSRFLKTSADGDRLSLEPYCVAFEMAAGSQAVSGEVVAAVAEGRRRQDELAAEGLHKIIGDLESVGRGSIVAALLVNRAGWITDLTRYSLAFADHARVAEGLAVREALRFGCRRCSIDAAELDEKSLPGLAAETLCLSTQEIDLRLKALGAAVGKPWRKEQKLACLAGWVAVARRR
jgi:hypothetical protein